jgi:hypothetical protein
MNLILCIKRMSFATDFMAKLRLILKIAIEKVFKSVKITPYK